MITEPLLPPKSGYVEVEIDGVRKYKNVATGYIYGEEPEPEPTQIDMVEAQATYTAMMTDTLLEV